MIGKFFASFAAKLFGGISVGLLLMVVFLSIKLGSANNTIEKRNLALKAEKETSARYRDALAFFVNDGTIRISRGQQALKEHETVSADLKRQAEKIRTRTVTVGCKTPTEVIHAQGL